MASYQWPPISGGGSGGGVTSLNTLSGDLTLVAGTGITITPVGSNITIAATGGTGTVTSVSVVSANGFAGTVATATTTPAITLSTSITGLLKGNGTAISAATSGTDYSAGTSALTTGILKSTTATGALTIAVAADFPTLNQNTTGTASAFTGNLTGDVTSVAMVTTIPANKVTNAMRTQMATLTLKGNNTGGTANEADLTVAQVNAILPVFTSTLNGLAPLSGGGTTNFLRADGAWAAPSGGSGSVTSVSVVSANGLAGTVATSTTTPAITLSTSVTGILQGNGTAISAATTTGSGSVVLATAPTLTLPNATGLPLTTGVTGTLPIANGGTNLTVAGTDGQLLKSMNSTFINSSYTNPYVNYAGNAFAELNTNGYATYSNTAQNTPVNGTGGTATGLTFSRSTSTPLRGAASFSMVQANSTSLQGKGVSMAFTIDSADQAKPLQIGFDFNASSTFVVSNGTTAPLNDGTTTTNAGNSDIEVFLYDVTNSVLIPVSPQVITANGANNFSFKGIFQTASNSTSYRLIWHVATANANATGWTFKFTNVYVGVQKFLQGAPVTDWVAFTPVVGGSTTAPTFVNKTGFWRRDGDSMEVQMLFNNCSNVGSGMWQFQLPAGYTIDATKLAGAASTLVAGTPANGTVSNVVGHIVNSDTPYWDDGKLYYGGSNFVVGSYGHQFNSSSLEWDRTWTVGSNLNSGGNPQATTTSSLGLTFRVPIAGWSSTVVMSNDTDTRVVAARVFGAPSGATTGGQPIVIPSVSYDSSASYSVSTGRYTVSVSGLYKVYGLLSGSAAGTASIYLNGSTAGVVGFIPAASTALAFSGSVKCVAGDILDMRVSTTNTFDSNTNVTFERLSGPATIAATDSVQARYFSSSTSVSGSLATVMYSTKGWDSHSAYSTSTGIYTCPVSGKYQVNASIAMTGTFILNSVLDLQVQQTGSATQTSESKSFSGGAVTQMNTNVGDIFNLVAGDQLKVQVSNSGGTPIIAATTTQNWFSIARVGN